MTEHNILTSAIEEDKKALSITAGIDRADRKLDKKEVVWKRNWKLKMTDSIKGFLNV